VLVRRKLQSRHAALLAPVLAVVAAALAAGAYEGLTDRDWSIDGWDEWLDVFMASLLGALILTWAFFRVAAPPLAPRLRPRPSAVAVPQPDALTAPGSAAADSAPEAISKLLRTRVAGWAMSHGERASLEGIVAAIRPELAIEIGTHRGGSLGPISRYSRAVHTFDVASRPEVIRHEFPNVTFHVGDSHRLLAPLLATFAAQGRNVDFVLVDGDHATAGAYQDLVDLLASPAVGRSIILVHDAIHPRVRNALEQIDYDRFGKVSLVELDFVEGFAMSAGDKAHQAWGGFALIAAGWDDLEPVYAQRYPAPLVWEGFSRSLGVEDPITAAQVAHVEEQYETERNLRQLMESSLSWRLTKPLRAAKKLGRRS